MKSLVWLLLFASFGASAEQVYMTRNSQLKVGQTFETKFPTIFYISRPCPLPVVNREHMRRYTSNQGKEIVGCWGETIDGNVFTVVPNVASTSFSKKVFMTVDVLNDGKFKVVDIPPIVVP